MMIYNFQELISLQKEYPEYQLHLDKENGQEIVHISLNTYLPEELKEPRRIELVEKIKKLKRRERFKH